MNPSSSHQGVRKVRVNEDRAGQRIDNFLLGQLNGVPRTLVYKIIRKGQVRVNSKRVKAVYKLHAGDEVRIPPVTVDEKAPIKTSTQLKANIEAAILFEDERLLIVNKPQGLAVHGGSGIRYGLIEVLRELRPNCQRLELVHRLDRDTSGCIILAKRHSTLRQMHALMRDNQVGKKYEALVEGSFPQKLVAEEPLLKRHTSSGEWFVRVDKEGQSSKTIFKLLNCNQGYSLLEASLITGRTHQIRVHLQHHGYPVLGDEKYGQTEALKALKKKGFKRMFLHAKKLTFQHPHTQQKMEIVAPYDATWQSFLRQQQLLSIGQDET